MKYERNYPKCPICKEKYRGNEYKIEMYEEPFPNKVLMLNVLMDVSSE